jgi:hypothetical protein
VSNLLEDSLEDRDIEVEGEKKELEVATWSDKIHFKSFE